MQLPFNFSRKSLPVILFLLTMFLISAAGASAQAPLAKTTSLYIKPLVPAVCQGQAAVLSGGAYSHTINAYQWKVSPVSGGPYTNVDGGSGAHSSTYISEPLPAGTWFYVLSAGNGGEAAVSNEVAVTVHALPKVSGHASATTVCNGSPINLCGHGALSYAWSGNVEDKEPFCPTASMSYVLTGTDANGCSSSDTVNIIVNPLPEVVAHVSANVVNSGTAVKFSGSGAQSYAWSNGVKDNSYFTPSNSEIYVLTGTDANGCKNTDVITVVVNPVVASTAGIKN